MLQSAVFYVSGLSRTAILLKEEMSSLRWQNHEKFALSRPNGHQWISFGE